MMIILFIISLHAQAAISLDPENFVSCLEQSVQGNNEGKCENNGEANQCVGLRRALENSQKQSKCFARQGTACLTHGHLQNTQMQWLSTAAGHLALAHLCIKNRYTSQGSPKEALNDDAFSELLKKLNDGSGVFGLTSGEIIKRTLQGESLGNIIAQSPVGREIPPKDIQSMKDNANNPIAIETEEIEQIGGSNPKIDGENWKNIREAYVSQSASQGSAVFKSEEKKVERREARKTTRDVIFVENKNIYRRKIKNNPYSLGLDLSLFERINAAYERKASSLRSLDDFVF